MERYQQAMVNIMTRRASPQLPRANNAPSCEISSRSCCPITSTTTLTCPAGTPQDPSYLTIPFTAPSEEPMTAKEPKRAKEQEASMFIAGSDSQLIIGTSAEPFVRRTQQLCRLVNVHACVLFQVVTAAMRSAYRKTWREDARSLVTHSRASHCARDISRFRHWKCGASRTPSPFLPVSPLSRITAGSLCAVLCTL